MNYKIFLIICITGILVACDTSSKKQDTAAVEDRGNVTGSSERESGSAARSYGTGEDSRYGISQLEDPQNLLSQRIIYFAYDMSDIQSQYYPIVEAHASYLAANPNTVVSLEGHADERGSREYNLALGEKRSLSVKQQMTLLGVSPSQIRTISYGEERPVESGHDDYSWSQNRRVEIVY